MTDECNERLGCRVIRGGSRLKVIDQCSALNLHRFLNETTKLSRLGSQMIVKPELLIAIVSGILTLSASFFVAMYQARTEFRKMFRQLEQKYTTSLFDKRLEAYPLLFKILHDLNNEIEYNTQNKQQLVELQKEYDSWISSHAILLTPTTAKLVWGYHHYLIDILEQYPDDSMPEEQWVEIRNIQATIGKFLRTELGVYDTEAAGAPELEKPYIKAITGRLHQSSRKIRSRFGY